VTHAIVTTENNQVPYIRIGKCVYKKNKDGAKGEKKGCSDSVSMAKKYIKALHVHAESRNFDLKIGEVVVDIVNEVLSDLPSGHKNKNQQFAQQILTQIFNMLQEEKGK
jgi:hypothetical protein